MRVEDLEEALRTAAERQPRVQCDLDAVQAGGRRRQRARALGLSLAGAGLVAVLGVSLAVWTGGPGADHEVRTSGVAEATGQWEELPASPLSPRARVVGVWTGSVVLFVGGDTWLCPPNGDCAAPEEPPLADGAILDLTTDTWRAIEPAPIPFSHASTAVLGTDVYFLLDRGPGLVGTRPAFLRYSLGDDAWEELPLPPGDQLSGLVAAGEVLVAFSGSDEIGEVPDQLYDPSDGAWSALPADPLSPSFDRSMVWAEPHLYLFDKELVPQPGSDGPSVTRVARLVPGTDDWERLPDSEIISSSPWYAEGSLLVNPQLGGADGGQVGNYGRTHPNGGILDIDAQAWSALPEAPSESSNGVVGERGGLIYGGQDGLLLDLASMTWSEMPAVPGAGADSHVNHNVVAAGRDAVALGGEDWSTPSGRLLGDAWIWRTADPAGSHRPTEGSGDPTIATSDVPRFSGPDECHDTSSASGVVGSPACAAGFTLDGTFYALSCGAVRPEAVTDEVLARGTYAGVPTELRRVAEVDPQLLVAVRFPGGECDDDDEPLSPWSMAFPGDAMQRPELSAAICRVAVEEQRERNQCDRASR